MPLNSLTPYTLPSPVGPGDPMWSNVVLALSGNSSTISDSSNSNQTLNIGNAVLDSSVAKFGLPSILLAPGAGSTITAPAQAALNIAGVDACIRGWFEFDLMNHQNTLWRFLGANQYNPYLMIFGNGNMYLRTSNTAGDIVSPFAHGMVTGTLYHIEVDKVGNTYYVFINGTLMATGSTTDVVSESKGFSICEANNTSNVRFFDLEITVGAHRNTVSFTPPTAPNPTHG